MKKSLKIASIALLVILLLLGVLAWMTSHFINPNKFKGRISQYVYAKTGQVLVINGNMHWSLFPWIGLKATDLTYYNAPTFTPKVFVSAKEMDIKVKLIPLVTGQIEIGNITLNDAVLNLIKDKSGRYNWQTVGKQDKNNLARQEENHPNQMASMLIESLKIRNAKLNWLDQQKNSTTTLNGLNINSKHIQFGQPFPLALQFDLLDDQAKKLTIDLNSNIIIFPDMLHYSLRELKLSSSILNQDKPIDINVTGELTTDLHEQHLLADLYFEVENIKGKIKLIGNQLAKNATFTGNISTRPFNLQHLLARAGKPIKTKNSDTLKYVTLLSNFEINNSTVSLSQTHAKIDGSDILGNIRIQLKPKIAKFSLSLNSVNLNDYLPEEDEKTNKPDQPMSQNDNPTSTHNSSSPWRLIGKIKIAKLTADKIKFENVLATIAMSNSVIRLAPLQANLYHGQLNGAAIINKQQSNKTIVTIKQTITNLNVRDLLHEFSEADKLNGTANVMVDLNSAITANTNFLAGLNGSLQLDLTHGSIKGVDVIYQLSRAHAFIKRLPSPAITDTKQTEFASLTSHALVNDGVLNSKDISLSSQYLKVTGKGSASLVTKEINYRLNALAQPKLADENKHIGKEVTAYQVPIKITGRLTKPSVNLDFIELAKIFYSKQIEKPISDHIQKDIIHLKDNLKDKMQNQIKDKLKDFSPSKLLNKLSFEQKAELAAQAEPETETLDKAS